MSQSQIQALKNKLAEYDPEFEFKSVTSKTWSCTAIYKGKTFQIISSRDWDAINQVIIKIKEFEKNE